MQRRASWLGVREYSSVVLSDQLMCSFRSVTSLAVAAIAKKFKKIKEGRKKKNLFHNRMKAAIGFGEPQVFEEFEPVVLVFDGRQSKDTNKRRKKKYR